LRHVLLAPRGMYADNADLAYSPGGRQLAFSSGTSAKLWELSSGKVLCAWDNLPDGLTDALAFDAKGEKLLLFRAERKDGNESPYVCRIRNLFSKELWT
jgi:hypothetical protein